MTVLWGPSSHCSPPQGVMSITFRKRWDLVQQSSLSTVQVGSAQTRDSKVRQCH